MGIVYTNLQGVWTTVNVLQKTGARIRTLRKLMGISQEALAEKADLHYVYIGSMERGERNITLQNLEKIAKALNVELYELFEFEDLDITDDVTTAAILAALRDKSEEEKRWIFQIINLILNGK
ncbi:helix-turn-helix transcriptional regulator [Paenibacillus tyrfis]|uniref:helix-turn-helix transcriptional regulator n=1 Tax=Paenibacillus tyrfis TaxID=1501230 RepID=UPI00281506CD|nr:helix-turn-helix transcriptional regulator [Paenibacillus tyrfis]